MTDETHTPAGRLGRWIARLSTRPLALAAGIAGLAAGALAQEAGGAVDPAALRPPTPPNLGGPPSVVIIILVALVAAVVIFAAAFPAKRGHQD
jgi:hypothetical protein